LLVHTIRCNLQLLTMPTPSLILVPARFKTGKLYTPVATTSGGLVLGASGDFNVTRATTATRVNASGLIESVASGVPRLDYPLGGGCPALLVEPSAQNLATYSEDWTNYWNPALNVTWSGNVSGTTDPYGTNVADAMFETTATDNHAIFADYSVTSGTTYTFSFFVKSIIARNVRINGATSLPQQSTDVNLSTLAISGAGSSTCRVLNFGNGWARVSQTYTATGTGNGRFIIYSMSGTTQSFQGSTNNGLYFFGAQLETGSIATSYIPTTTGSVTRNAEVITLSGAVSGCIGQTEGVLYLEFIPPSGSTDRIFAITDGTLNNRIAISRATSTRLEVIVRSSGSVVNGTIGSSAATAFNPNAPNKVAYAYKSGDFALAINGSVVASGTTTFAFTSTLNDLGTTESSLGSIFINRIRSVALYTTRLTNAELAALTTL
jgi:hypothetical protein